MVCDAAGPWDDHSEGVCATCRSTDNVTQSVTLHMSLLAEKTIRPFKDDPWALHLQMPLKKFGGNMITLWEGKRHCYLCRTPGALQPVCTFLGRVDHFHKDLQDPNDALHLCTVYANEIHVIEEPKMRTKIKHFGLMKERKSKNLPSANPQCNKY